MNRHENALNHIHKHGKSIKDEIEEEYYNVKRDYIQFIELRSKQDINCRILLLRLKTICCLHNNDYIGYCKYLNRYKQLSTEVINNMSEKKPTDKPRIMISSKNDNTDFDISTHEPSMIKIYTDTSKQIIKNAETYSRCLFGKI